MKLKLNAARVMVSLNKKGESPSEKNKSNGSIWHRVVKGVSVGVSLKIEIKLILKKKNDTQKKNKKFSVSKQSMVLTESE